MRLFKLHGSINWFLYGRHPTIGRNEPVGIPPIDEDFRYTKNLNGQLQWPENFRPVMLIGTFNKMLQYTSGIYADLYSQFYSALPETELLILCGYGFGDKGINTRLVEWAYSSDQNIMVVIHEKPENLKKRARGAISKNWGPWLQSNQLLFVKKWIQDTSWKDIRDVIQK